MDECALEREENDLCTSEREDIKKISMMQSEKQCFIDRLMIGKEGSGMNDNTDHTFDEMN